jgi:hypothetical protein
MVTVRCPFTFFSSHLTIDDPAAHTYRLFFFLLVLFISYVGMSMWSCPPHFALKEPCCWVTVKVSMFSYSQDLCTSKEWKSVQMTLRNSWDHLKMVISVSADIVIWAWVWRDDMGFCSSQTSYCLKKLFSDELFVCIPEPCAVPSFLLYSCWPNCSLNLLKKACACLQESLCYPCLTSSSPWIWGLRCVEQNSETEKPEVKFHGTCTEVLPCWLFPLWSIERNLASKRSKCPSMT